MSLDLLKQFPTTFRKATFRKLAQIFDGITHSLCAIDYAHHEVHEGDMYSMGIYDEDAALGHVIQIHFKTPPTADPQKRCHMVFEHSATGEYLFEILEDATYTSGGIATVPFNRNRDSNKVSSLLAPRFGSNKGVDVIVFGGTAVVLDGIWTGSGKGSGGSSRSEEEWVLAPDTEYLVQMTSESAGNKMHIRTVHYEHTDSSW